MSKRTLYRLRFKNGSEASCDDCGGRRWVKCERPGLYECAKCEQQAESDPAEPVRAIRLVPKKKGGPK